ncbi:hypothetical protein LN042_27170 [Kitasatospora sp. RB6PN24]|uniref:hypothetical protein n=1 Tax=Kitasatospora humi TaxID=2893891 RepID=UPI001E4A3798|nr:hypothetical protein [Kitasatospora humi]MCC9310708.1 hypothetical protein [Kitasatospora humi]
MDPELATLASTASATIIQLAVTDSWKSAKSAMVRLWSRSESSRGDIIEADLEETRGEILAAPIASREAVLEDARIEWQSRLRRLLVSSPEAVAELREILEEFTDFRDSTSSDSIKMNARSSGRSRIYQLGKGVQRNG